MHDRAATALGQSMVIKEPTSSTFVFRREAGTWLTALVWHPRLECWLPSGGHVESSENIAEAAIREAREFPVKSTC
jgi:ADP-ribose pyrophosphatase YjhB (NUDIX family)